MGPLLGQLPQSCPGISVKETGGEICAQRTFYPQGSPQAYTYLGWRDERQHPEVCQESTRLAVKGTQEVRLP